MSNISVDLKVIEVTAPMVARALNEPVALTLGGLNLLWHRCWSLKSDTITAVGLAGIFGPEKLDVRIAQLVDAGFLEAVGAGFRIKGAERYLRIKAGNSKGGHASKGNLIPGGKRPPQAEGEPRGEPSATPADTSAHPSAPLGSSPNTEHRTPNTIEKKGETQSVPLQLEALPAKAVKTRKPPDPQAEFEKFKANCTDDELAVFEAYSVAFAIDLAPDWGLKKLVGQKLRAHTAEELCAAMRGAGKTPWHRENGSSMRALLSDASKVAQLAKKGAA